MAQSDFNIWYKSFDESFLYINERSNIKNDWLNYDEVLKTEHKDSILKPINKNFYKLCPPPKLVSIEKNSVTLCQENFAEIFLLKKIDSLHFGATEKIHMRQFYLSKEKLPKVDDCFDPVFRWAMPWFLDIDDIEVSISTAPDSPFYFYDFKYTSKKNIENRIDPRMLFFKFKNVGSHMIDNECGRIKRQQPAYLIKFSGSDIMIDKIKEFYVKG